jgi:hypothetical protein
MDAAEKMGGPEKDDSDVPTGKKCSRCGKYMKGGGYCCSSESAKEGSDDGPEYDDPDDVQDVKLPKPRKKRPAPSKIGSLAEDMFGGN